MKVNLPKVEEETRTELNIIKAQRRDGTLNDTIQELIEDSKAVKNLTENNNLLRTELFEAKKKIKELENNNYPCEWYRLDMGHKLCVHSENKMSPCNEALCPLKDNKKELEETTLSKDEASALYSAIGDVDLWKEDDEYKALVQSAVNKLWKMKQEL